MVRLEALSNKPKELKLIAEARNKYLKTLRTCLETTNDQQEGWVKSCVDKGDIYYFIYQDNVLVGYCGLDKLNRYNRTAEISLVMITRGRGYGKQSAELLMDKAFNYFNLNCLYGEVYTTSDNWKFWEKCGFKMEGRLRDRKYWEGKYLPPKV